MKCNCVHGRIGRPDLPEGEETCWQCDGTGSRKTLYVEGFGSMSGPEGKSEVPFKSTFGMNTALRDFMERHKPEFITIVWEDGSERYTMEKSEQ